MAKRAPQDATGVFGSRARALILGYLAQLEVPRTGYSIAKDLGLGMSNVYPELERLEGWGVVRGRKDVKGRRVFEMADEDLRRFLVRRVRIISSDDWFSPGRAAQREAQAREAAHIKVKVPKGRVKRKGPPMSDEFRRLAEKDRALKRMGAARGGAP